MSCRHRPTVVAFPRTRGPRPGSGSKHVSRPGHAGAHRRAGAGAARRAGGQRQRAVRRRQRLDADLVGAGSADDRPGPGALLRRPGAQEEHSRHHDAELRHDGPGEHSVGAGGLFAGLRPRQPVHRRLRASVSARRSLTPNPDYARDHSRADLHDLPAHVRHHHAGADHRRVCRAHEVQLHGGLSLAVVARSSTARWRTWCGAWADC